MEIRYNLNDRTYSVGESIFSHDSLVSWVQSGGLAKTLLNDKVYLITEKSNHKEEKLSFRNFPLQQIYFGAPGTGKSHTIEAYTKGLSQANVFRTTFHPDSDYASFVGCYKPSMKPATTKVILDYDSLVDKFKEYLSADSNITRACTKFGFDYHDSIVKMQENGTHTIPVLVADAYKSGTTYDTQVRAGMNVYETSHHDTGFEDKIVYSFIPQAFTKAYIRAWQTTEPVFLVIEEINRGNCAQIFGDLFQLLDRKNNVSEYPIKPDTDLGTFICDTFAKEGSVAPDGSSVIKGEELQLPPNLYIWATMNTSDQSLFPIDSAFKRRWQWKYCPITDAGLNYQIAAGDKQYNWWKVISFINQEIENVTKSEDKKLGYFFVQADYDNIITADTFVNKVVFYLWNDVFRDAYANSLFADGLTFYRFFDADGKTDTEVLQQFLSRILNSESPA